MESNTRKGGIHVSFSTNSVFWFLAVWQSFSRKGSFRLVVVVVVVVVGGGGGGGGDGGFLGFLAEPRPKTHLVQVPKLTFQMQRRTQFKIPIGDNFPAVLGKMVDLFAGKNAGFNRFFALISLENTPNLQYFTRTKKETPSESVGEGYGVSFCLSMLVEGGLYQFYDFYTGIFEPAAI